MTYYSKKRAKIIFKRRLRFSIFFIFSPIFILFLLSILFFNWNLFRISEIKISPTYFVRQEIIQNDVINILDQNFWFIYPKNNVLLYPKTEIIRRLKNKYQNIKDISLSLENWGKTLDINIAEYQIYSILWLENNEIYLLNIYGDIFNKYQKERDGDIKNFLILEVKEKNDINFININIVNKIISFFKSLDINITKIRVNKTEQQYIFYTDKGPRIIISFTQSSEQIKQVFSDIIKKGDLQYSQILKNFIKKISYINLSYNKYIFYCLLGEECQDNYK